MTTITQADSLVMQVHDTINQLDIDRIADLPTDMALTCWSILEDAHRILAQVRSQLTGLVAEKMGEHQRTVEGVGTFIRHMRKDRTRWEKDDLLRAVLDSRLPVDPTTGELAPEDQSPLAKVLHVWNLPAPRTTALKARGLDADEFCHVERGGWQIEAV